MRKSSLLFFLGILGLQEAAAQQSAVTSGGDGSGPGGSVAYSVGQVVYTEITGPGGSAIQGVQQPYEIYLLETHTPDPISLIMKVYPNPTVADVVLMMGNLPAEKVEYTLYDMRGRLLLKQRIVQNETIIPMEAYAGGNYLLTVSSGGKTLKTFKILKKEI